jgi:hypothetical protein
MAHSSPTAPVIRRSAKPSGCEETEDSKGKLEGEYQAKKKGQEKL